MTDDEDALPPPPRANVWDSSENISVHYVVRQPWKWVMEGIKHRKMKEVFSPSDLPSNKAASIGNNGNIETTPGSTPTQRRRRENQRRRRMTPSTLKIDICDGDNRVILAAHGNSAALDGLEDKDELIRTMQRCRCEDKVISPPTILINWDATREECSNVVGTKLPSVEGNDLEEKFAVLKDPMGSQGSGIFFVQSADEIHKIVDEHRQRASADPGFLDRLISAKGRIPSWGMFYFRFFYEHDRSSLILCVFTVVQAEVYPSLLVKGRRKFHIRTYVVVLEKLYSPEVVDIYLFNRHEVRIAGTAVAEGDQSRDPQAHITNGAMSSTTERVLIDDVPELTDRGMKEKIEQFVATTFGKDLIRDIAGRVRVNTGDASGACKFAVAGLDLMVTESGRIYLLEVNVNPSAPSEDTVTSQFKEHLQGFFHDLAALATGNTPSTFSTVNDILSLG